ncbi:MAG: chorismate-binding protein [Ferrimicrobium sp.]
MMIVPASCVSESLPGSRDDLLRLAQAAEERGLAWELVGLKHQIVLGVGTPRVRVGHKDEHRSGLPWFFSLPFKGPEFIVAKRYPLVVVLDETGGTISIASEDGRKQALVESLWSLATTLKWPSEIPAVSRSLVEGEFSTRYHRAMEALERGLYAKVVISATERFFIPQFSSAQALRLLARRYPRAHLYANESGFGASPELVASVWGGNVLCRPLAGTALREHKEDLLTSQKDIYEHRIMVTQLIEDLAPLAKELEPTSDAVLFDAGPLVHLMTEVRGRLLPGIGLEGVLGAISPTAAVSGVPRSEVLRMLNDLEPDRNLYGGVVGVVTTSGEGEAYLAIRGGSVHGDEVELRAGVGLVSQSSYDSELAEVRAKLRATADVLGFE